MAGTTSGETERFDWLRRSDRQSLLPVMKRSISGSGLHCQDPGLIFSGNDRALG